MAAKGKIKIEGDAKEVLAMFKAMDRGAKNTEGAVKKSGNKMSKSFDGNMKKMQKSAKATMTFMQGAFAFSMLKMVADQVKATEKLGLKTKFLAQNNKVYADSIDAMVAASSGFITSSDAITIANVLTAAGINLTSEEFVEFSRNATIMSNKLDQEVGPTMLKFAKGVALDRDKLIDDLIPALKKSSEIYEELATSLGKTVSELTEVEKKAGKTASRFKELGGGVSELDKKIMKTGARFTGQLTDIVSGVNLAFSKYLQFLNYLADKSDKWGDARADAAFESNRVEIEAHKRLTAAYKKELFDREGLTLGYFIKQVKNQRDAHKKLTDDTKKWYNVQLKDYKLYKDGILSIDETDTYNPFEVVKRDMKAASILTSKEREEEKKRKEDALAAAKRSYERRYDVALNTYKVGAKKLSDFEDGEAFLQDKKKRERWAKRDALDKEWTIRGLKDRLTVAKANLVIDKVSADKMQAVREKRDQNLKLYRQNMQAEKKAALIKEQSDIDNVILKKQQRKEALRLRYVKIGAKDITDFKTAQAYVDDVIDKKAALKKLLNIKNLSEKELEALVLTAEYKKAIADKEEAELMERGQRIFDATSRMYSSLTQNFKSSKDVEEQIRRDEIDGIKRTDKEKQKMREDATMSLEDMARQVIGSALIQAGGEVYADGIKTIWKGGSKLFSPATAAVGAGEIAYGTAEVVAGLGMGYVGTSLLPDTSTADESKADAASDRSKDVDTDTESNTVVFMYESEREHINQLAKANRKLEKTTKLGR